MKELKVRQICFIILIFLPVTKFFILPSALATFAKQDILIAAAINLILDLIVFLAILNLIKKSNGQTFYNILTNNLGKATAKIIYFAYAVFFVIKAAMLCVEQKFYIDLTLYETSPTLFIFLPFFIVTFFACLKGLKVYGKIADIMVWFGIVSFFLILFLSFSSANFSEILPIGGNKFSETFKGAKTTSVWFFDSSYLLFFIGSFNYDKKSFKKLFISFIGFILIVLVFLLFFYAIFSDIAVRKVYAISKIAKYSVALLNIGRFDFIALFLILAVTIYAICLPIILSTNCLKETFNFKNKIIPALIVNGFLILSVIFFSSYQSSLKMFMGQYIVLFIFIMGFIIPILTLFLKKGKKHAQNKN